MHDPQLRRVHGARCRPAPRRRAPSSGTAATPTLATAGVAAAALHFHRRDVLAAAADHVLLAVDEVKVAVRVAPIPCRRCGTSRRPRPRRVAASILQVAHERIRSEVAAPAQRTSSSPGLSGRQSAPRSSTTRCRRSMSARAEACAADVARLAVGDDDGARAGLGHCPGLQQREAEALLEGRMVSWVDAGAEAEAHLVLAVARDGGAAAAWQASRPGSARSWRAIGAYALPPASGWKRSSGTMQPPVRIMPSWSTPSRSCGSGQRRDQPIGSRWLISHRPPTWVPRAGARKYSLGSTQPLGRPWCPRCRAARTRCRCRSSGSIAAAARAQSQDRQILVRPRQPVGPHSPRLHADHARALQARLPGRSRCAAGGTRVPRSATPR